MTQNAEQNVRTREEQIDDLTNLFGEEGTFTFIDDRDAAIKHILEAEARGAAEQRRKDAEGQLKLWIAKSDFLSLTDVDEGCDALHQCATVSRDCCKLLPDDVPLYTRPANVAALEAKTERRFQHIKRGTEYRLIGRGKIQQNGPSDMAEVVIYQDVNDGSFWVRSPSEFYDGRFKEIFDALTREGGV